MGLKSRDTKERTDFHAIALVKLDSLARTP
jgi:hypothetical protein